MKLETTNTQSCNNNLDYEGIKDMPNGAAAFADRSGPHTGWGNLHPDANHSVKHGRANVRKRCTTVQTHDKSIRISQSIKSCQYLCSNSDMQWKTTLAPGHTWCCLSFVSIYSESCPYPDVSPTFNCFRHK